MRALLANGEQRRPAAVLVVCATNHALDQFLEGVLPYEERLVRIGSRSKSEALERLNLRALVRAEWEADEERQRTRRQLHRRLKELAATLELLSAEYEQALPGSADVSAEEMAAGAGTARRQRPS